MSQAGIINVIDNNPSIPIDFDADTGTASAILNVINIIGAGGITTSASGNTITINGSGISPNLTLTGNTGGALSPTANNWNILGDSIAAGTTPVQVNGAVSTLTVNVQRSQAIASTNSTNVGLAAFNSTQFSVDANGFVSLAASGPAIQTITGDSGVVSGSNINLYARSGSALAGSSVRFVAASATEMDLNTTDALFNTFVGRLSGNTTLTGAANHGFGNGTLRSVTSGLSNIGIGFNTLFNITTGSYNVAIGHGNVSSALGPTVSNNTIVGYEAATGLQNGGDNNTALGYLTFNTLTTGANNIAIGANAGGSLTTSDSNNICVGNVGVAGDNNIMRLGTSGSGSGQVNKTFIAGVAGVSVSNAVTMVMDSTTGQAGTSSVLAVLTVSGTTNRITSTGGQNPVIDIDANYVGQSSITTLGTIATGTWSATNIALNKGGTNAALTASNGGIFYSTATAGAILAGTATAGQIIRSGASSAPTWSTTTYPATNAINTLLYASAANVMSALATANGGVLTTSSSGVPSIDTTNFSVLSTGVQVKGNNTNTAPPAGFLGEEIRAVGTSVSVTTGSATTIASITLTAGIWSISALASANTGSFAQTLTFSRAAISTATNNYTGTADGDNSSQFSSSAFLGNQTAIAIPSYRVTISGSTTYYLVCSCNFGSGTCSVSGRISGIRVG